MVQTVSDPLRRDFIGFIKTEYSEPLILYQVEPARIFHRGYDLVNFVGWAEERSPTYQIIPSIKYTSRLDLV